LIPFFVETNRKLPDFKKTAHVSRQPFSGGSGVHVSFKDNVALTKGEKGEKGKGGISDLKNLVLPKRITIVFWVCNVPEGKKKKRKRGGKGWRMGNPFLVARLVSPFP